MSNITESQIPTLKKINEIVYSSENMKLQNTMLSVVDAFCVISKKMFTLEYKARAWSGVPLFDKKTGKVLIDKYQLLFSEMALYCLKSDIYEEPKYIDLHKRINLGIEFMKEPMNRYILINMIECHTNYEDYKLDHTNYIIKSDKTFLPMAKYLKNTNQKHKLMCIKTLYFPRHITILKDIYVEYDQNNFDETVNSIMEYGLSQENAIAIAGMLSVELLKDCYAWETLSNVILHEMIQKGVPTGLDE